MECGSLLRFDMPVENRLVGYTDDVTALISGRVFDTAQLSHGHSKSSWVDRRSRHVSSA